MSKRLFVGNLPWSTTDEELRTMFAGVGAVDSASVITDKFSGRSRGFGFVEMPNDDEAQKAIDSLNGSKIGERQIVVNEARPKAAGGDRRGGFGGGRDRDY